MLKNHEEAWDELKNRLENFLWTLEHDKADEQRIRDTKSILAKMEYFEDEIRSQNDMTYTCPDCGMVYETDEIEDLTKDSEYEWEFICTNPECKGAFRL